MKLACCTWTLFGIGSSTTSANSEASNRLTQLGEVGFRWMDARPGDLSTDRAHTKMSELHMGATCIGISFGIPEQYTLHSKDPDELEKAIDFAQKGVDDVQKNGARTAYVVPPLDDSQQATERFAIAIPSLADYAAERGVKLCIEHFPGRGLDTVDQTLDSIHELDHPNLYLLFDLGHAQITKEEPGKAIRKAGDLLGYVHLDNNDGEQDLHWALLDGVMTHDALASTFVCCFQGYRIYWRC